MLERLGEMLERWGEMLEMWGDMLEIWGDCTTKRGSIFVPLKRSVTRRKARSPA